VVKIIRTLFIKLGFLPRKKALSGGIDAGRSRFSSPPNQPKSTNKTVLRKINEWWLTRKPAKKGAQIEIKRGIFSPRTLWLLWLGTAGMVGFSLFSGIDGSSLVQRALAQIDLFKIVVVSVEGETHSDAEQIRASSGIMVSESMFSVSSEDVKYAVTSANPWIADVEIIRRWPGEIIIEVDEYEPYALMTSGAGGGGRLFYVDRRGYPFAPVVAGDDLDFPVITGIELEPDTAGTQEQLSEPLRFLNMLGGNDPNLPAQSVSEIHLDAEHGMVVHLVEYPFPIFLGTRITREKYHRLRKVLEVLYKPRRHGMNIGTVDYISMDYLPDKVIISTNESG
jgi:cell division protein FtsQ